MQEQVLEIGDLHVNYKKFYRESNVIDILILHGWGGRSDSWIEVGELLVKKGFNVIVPDLPGFGKTKITKNYALDDYAKLVEEFYKKLELKNIILWGHSNGGAISITLNYRGKIEIERLVLNNSAGIRKDEKRSIKRKIFNTISGIVKPLLKGENKVIKKLRQLFYRVIGGQDYLEAEKNPFLKQTYLNMIGSDLQDKIAKIDTNTLLIWGEKDNYTPVSDAHIMRKTIKHSKLVILDNETHGIHLKNPNRLVDTFVNNI